ncbi:putative B-box type zinc finger protein with CCT domain [Hibiscus syriacus]|uniref:B-box type zinc finger protein with CCT domain n=1 Tax=Hibiscus syriacus TaxID=106335 RepID=A0A6A2Y1S7_HIBSY|nr:putative B-box type zinc finger protein with CCT domain [Hibiscus syriacus]
MAAGSFGRAAPKTASLDPALNGSSPLTLKPTPLSSRQVLRPCRPPQSHRSRPRKPTPRYFQVTPIRSLWACCEPCLWFGRHALVGELGRVPSRGGCFAQRLADNHPIFSRTALAAAAATICPLKTYDIRHVFKHPNTAETDKVVKSRSRFKRSADNSKRRADSSSGNREEESLFSVETVEGSLVNRTKNGLLQQFASQTEESTDIGWT